MPFHLLPESAILGDKVEKKEDVLTGIVLTYSTSPFSDMQT